MKTQAAQVANTIRKELKVKFPGINFKVHSSNFSGGDDVRIHYENAIPAEDVEKIVNKYAGGSFDGMTDMYNYDYDKTGPTAKYIFVERHISEDIWEKTKLQLAKNYDINPNDENEWQRKFGCWSTAAIHRNLVNKYL
jgi:glyceraldehyde-3-phosphate dehydrogenase/erythrose-4-phosphate dehydrogenase